ncbi:MAG: class I SAM-dependent methyltransferase [Chloroflexi bacterium]|nr:class I SAM-dependent methyltransferase [Chloroflexota bacterium]
MSPQFADYPRYAWQLLQGDRSSSEATGAAWRTADIAPYLDLSRPRDILDLGNGRLRPQYSILRAQGHRVIGIDLVNRPASGWKDVAYVVARRIYLHRLGLPVMTAAPAGLVCGHAGLLPFADHTFDLVTSIAAFEHFLDVPAVLSEVARVLRPGGVIWALVHLFTSPSGGHNLSFTEVPLQHIPPGVEPWDHLRSRRLPFNVPLNEWRAHQYLAEFGRHLEVLKQYCATREGETWLNTPEAAELLQAGYTADELTCCAYVIVARKAG